MACILSGLIIAEYTMHVSLHTHTGGEQCLGGDQPTSSAEPAKVRSVPVSFLKCFSQHHSVKSLAAAAAGVDQEYTMRLFLLQKRDMMASLYCNKNDALSTLE